MCSEMKEKRREGRGKVPTYIQRFQGPRYMNSLGAVVTGTLFFTKYHLNIGNAIWS